MYLKKYKIIFLLTLHQKLADLERLLFSGEYLSPQKLSY